MKKFFGKSKCSEARDLPSFACEVAIARDRVLVAKWALYGVLALTATSLCVEELRISKLTTALTEKDYLIVPGAPEFMRIRPGLIAAESVYLFAEWAASQLATFSYNTVDSQYRSFAEFMSPELKTRFLLSMERPLKMFKDLRIDEVFELEPVKSFDLKNDERGPKYIVRVRGTARKYFEGSLRETVASEIITFVFRPRKIKPNQVWFFEIESYDRMTSEEEARVKALDSLKMEVK